MGSAIWRAKRALAGQSANESGPWALGKRLYGVRCQIASINYDDDDDDDDDVDDDYDDEINAVDKFEADVFKYFVCTLCIHLMIVGTANATGGAT